MKKSEPELIFDDRQPEVKEEMPIPLEVWKHHFGDAVPYPEEYKKAFQTNADKEN